jgi:hypothetical protein
MSNHFQDQDQNQDVLLTKKQNFIQKILIEPMVRDCIQEYIRKDVSLLTEAVASTCSNNNNGGIGCKARSNNANHQTC